MTKLWKGGGQMEELTQITTVDDNEFYQTLRSYIVEAQKKIYVAVNDAMVTAYWKIGRDINILDSEKFVCSSSCPFP